MSCLSRRSRVQWTDARHGEGNLARAPAGAHLSGGWWRRRRRRPCTPPCAAPAAAAAAGAGTRTCRPAARQAVLLRLQVSRRVQAPAAECGVAEPAVELQRRGLRHAVGGGALPDALGACRLTHVVACTDTRLSARLFCTASGMLLTILDKTVEAGIMNEWKHWCLVTFCIRPACISNACGQQVQSACMSRSQSAGDCWIFDDVASRLHWRRSSVKVISQRA